MFFRYKAKNSSSNQARNLNNNNFDINAEYIKPDNLEELPLIIESLQTGKLVLLNLDSIDLKDRERFTDLIFGAIVGMKGNMKK